MDVRTNIDETWWSGVAEGKLLFMRCLKCNRANFYPRLACVDCLSTALSWEESSGEGTVYACTRVHVAPDKTFAQEVPYFVVLAEMKEGFRFMAKLSSSSQEQLAVGDRVTFTTETSAGQVRPALTMNLAAAPAEA